MVDDNDVFAGLEGLFDDVDESDIINVKTMTINQLLDAIVDLTEELLNASQGLRPNNQEARDAHSLRNACQIELRSRGIPA